MTTHPIRSACGRRTTGATRSAAWLVSLALAGLFASAAPAQDRPRDEKKPEKKEPEKKKDAAKFDVQVLAIQATKKNAEIADELKPLAAKLKDSTGCTGFKVGKKSNGNVAQDETFKTELSGGYRVELTPQERSDQRVKLKVVIARKDEKDKDGKEKQPVNTVLDLESGSSQLYTFPNPDAKEDKLVIAVSAK